MYKIGPNKFMGGGRVCEGGVFFVRYAFFTIKNARLLNLQMVYCRSTKFYEPSLRKMLLGKFSSLEMAK